MQSRTQHSRQSGAALVVSLILLLVMTIIGVTAMRNTTLEEKMAGNSRNHSLAFQAAEAALREAEEEVAGWDKTSLPSFGAGAGGYYDEAHAPDLNDDDTWSSKSIAATTVPGTAAAPRYVVQRVGVVHQATGSIGLSHGMAGTGNVEITVFEITTLGVGGSDTAQVLLRSHYGKAL